MSLTRWAAVLLLCSCLLAGAAAASVAPATPMDTVKSRIDQIIGVLNNPVYQKPDEKAAQRKKIWEIAKPMFDFREISRRTVGPKWKEFSTEEKNQFTNVFSEFLGNTYIDKIQGEYHDEKIVYLKELVRKPLALVRTKLERANGEIPIDYRLKLEDEHWRVYDILVENGVSLVQNYRVQFRSILEKESPADLIQRLKKKLAEQDQSLK